MVTTTNIVIPVYVKSSDLIRTDDKIGILAGLNICSYYYIIDKVKKPAKDGIIINNTDMLEYNNGELIKTGRAINILIKDTLMPGNINRLRKEFSNWINLAETGIGNYLHTLSSLLIHSYKHDYVTVKVPTLITAESIDNIRTTLEKETNDGTLLEGRPEYIYLNLHKDELDIINKIKELTCLKEN